MNLKIAAAVAALSVATVPAAFADENCGLVPRWWCRLSSMRGSTIRTRSTTRSTPGMRTTTRTSCSRGYRLNKFLAFELDYINLGEPSGAVVPGFNVDAAVDGFAPYVVGTIPLGKWFEVYGRLGYYFYDANIGVEDEINGNRVEFDEESEDLVYGAGIGANIGERLNVRFEYEKFDLEGTG